MSDRISLMLDTMITAVDEGFSYDGIVSMPEIGLEDAVSRRGLAGWLDDSVELIRTTRTAISQAAARLFRNATPMDDNRSPVDSKISTGDKNIDKVPHSPQPIPASQATYTSKQELRKEEEEGDGAQSGPVEQLPRKSEHSPRFGVGEKLPRKKSEQVLEDTARGEDKGGLQQPRPITGKLPKKKSRQALEDHLPRLDVNPKLPRKQNEQVLEDTTHVENEKGHQQPHLVTGKLPRKRNEQVLEDIAGPNVGQSLPVPKDDEQGLTGGSQPQLADLGTLPRKRKPSSDDQERLPRKKDNDENSG